MEISDDADKQEERCMQSKMTSKRWRENYLVKKKVGCFLYVLKA